MSLIRNVLATLWKSVASGAVARPISALFEDRVSVLNFGAKGDGATDDSAAIQAALNWINTRGGGTLYVPARHYIINTPMVGYSNTRLIAEPGATFDFSQRATPLSSDSQLGLFSFSGTAGAQILLTAQASLGATQIALASTTGLAVGSMIELSQSVSNTGNFSESSVAVFSGQLATVVAISGSNVTLDTTVFETLPMANTPRVRVVTPVENIVVDGLTMVASGRPEPSGDGDIGLCIYFGRHVTVQNCVFSRVDLVSMRFTSCLGFRADNNRLVTDAEGANTVSDNYGIVYASSQDGTISRNAIANYRHGVVSSNLSGALPIQYFGVSRFITIRDNYITNTWHAGIAAHNDVEHLLICNNRIENCYGGVNMRDRNVQVIGNRITNCFNAMWLTVAPQRQVWRGNVIIDCTNTLVVSSLATNYVYSDILVEDNDITATGTSQMTGILFTGSGSTSTCRDIVVRGNKFSDLTGTAGNDAAIRFSGYFSGEICDNVIHNCANIGGIHIDTAPVSVGIRRNRVTNTGGTPIYIAGAGTDSYCTDNYAKGYTSSSAFTGVTNVTNRNNDDGGSANI